MTLFYQSDSDSSDSGLSDTESGLDFSDSLTYSLGDVEVSEEPRRVGRVRKHLLEALLATFSILHAVSPGEGLDSPIGKIESKSPTWKRFCARMDDPWKQLEGCVGEIARNLGDGRIKGISEIVAGLSILHHLAEMVLIPLAADKRYIKDTLSRSETRSVRPFLKHLKRLRERELCRATYLGPASVEVLRETPPAILARTAILSLSPPVKKAPMGTLNLSALPYFRPQIILHNLRLGELFETFGRDPAKLTRITLSHNHLDTFPRFFLLCFPNLERLDVSFNSNLTALPLFTIRLTRRIEVYTRSTKLVLWPNEWLSLGQGNPGRGPPSEPSGSALRIKSGTGPVTLVQTCLETLLREKESVANIVNTSSSFAGPSSISPADSARCVHNRGYPESEPDMPIIESETLLSHLAEKLEQGYICEQCYNPVLPDAPEFLLGEAEVPWKVQASPGDEGVLMRDGTASKLIRISAKLCVGCYRSLWDESGVGTTCN